jgi:hypothetical protein
VGLFAQAVFDLRYRRQNEAIPMLDRAATRGEQEASDPARARFTHVFDLDTITSAPDGRTDLVALRSAEEATVQKRGVRHVERILQRGLQRGGCFYAAKHTGVAGAERAQLERFGDGCVVELRPDPNQTVAFAHGTCRRAALTRFTRTREAGD